MSSHGCKSQGTRGACLGLVCAPSFVGQRANTRLNPKKTWQNKNLSTRLHQAANCVQAERCRRCARRAGVVVDLRDDYVGADTADRGVRVETREKIEKVLHVDPETHIAGCEKQL
jgi:transposase